MFVTSVLRSLPYIFSKCDSEKDRNHWSVLTDKGTHARGLRDSAKGGWRHSRSFTIVGAHTKVQGPLSSGRIGKPAWEGLGNESGCLECGTE